VRCFCFVVWFLPLLWFPEGVTVEVKLVYLRLTKLCDGALGVVCPTRVAVAMCDVVLARGVIFAHGKMAKE
jgi:hypothetical protein